MGTMKHVKGILAVVAMLWMGVAAAAPVPTTPDVTAQVVARIRSGLREVQPHLGVPTHKAVTMLDAMLVQQYGAKGHLANEPDATLKPGYYEAATLLMNGYPIAGGTLVSALRQTPAWRRSASAPALGAFVDAMLAPTDEEDADLIAFQKKARAIDAGLRTLPFAVRFPAQVWLMGEVYHDAIATRAGQDVLNGTSPTAAQRQQIAVAQRAAAAIPVPKPSADLP